MTEGKESTKQKWSRRSVNFSTHRHVGKRRHEPHEEGSRFPTDTSVATVASGGNVSCAFAFVLAGCGLESEIVLTGLQVGFGSRDFNCFRSLNSGVQTPTPGKSSGVPTSLINLKPGRILASLNFSP